jgi:hypothetical protein
MHHRYFYPSFIASLLPLWIRMRSVFYCSAFHSIIRCQTRKGEVQVEIFSAGDGVNYPKKGQTVTVHYTGFVSDFQLVQFVVDNSNWSSFSTVAQLADGSQFDSSRDRGKPFKFKLGPEQVIPGSWSDCFELPSSITKVLLHFEGLDEVMVFLHLWPWGLGLGLG